jgi:hypothetical protein
MRARKKRMMGYEMKKMKLAMGRTICYNKIDQYNDNNIAYRCKIKTK